MSEDDLLEWLDEQFMTQRDVGNAETAAMYEAAWKAVRERDEARAALDAGRELMRQSWSQLNAIRAWRGAPPGVCEEWFSELVDGMAELLRDDCLPWMTKAASALVEPYRKEIVEAQDRALAAEQALTEARAEIERLRGLFVKVEAFVESIAASRDGVLEIVRAALPPPRNAAHHTNRRSAMSEPRIDEIVTALYRRFKDWSKRGFGPDDVTWCEVRADVVALAAGLREQIRAEAIREAVEVAGNWRPDLVMENVARGWATEDIATAILALLDPAPDEQPAQKGDAP
jgi:hypothetical protein